jgi:hypothetical protein
MDGFSRSIYLLTEQTHGRRNFQHRYFVLDVDHGGPWCWLSTAESSRQQVRVGIKLPVTSECQNVSLCRALCGSLVMAIFYQCVGLGKHGFPIFLHDRDSIIGCRQILTFPSF